MENLHFYFKNKNKSFIAVMAVEKILIMRRAGLINEKKRNPHA